MSPSIVLQAAHLVGIINSSDRQEAATDETNGRQALSCPLSFGSREATSWNDEFSTNSTVENKTEGT